MNDKNKDTTIIMPPYSNNNSEWTSSNSSTTSSSRVTNNQQPKSALHLSSSVNNNQQPNDLLELAAQELETMKQPKKQQSYYYVSKIPTDEHSFPPRLSPTHVLPSWKSHLHLLPFSNGHIMGIRILRLFDVSPMQWQASITRSANEFCQKCVHGWLEGS